MTRAMLAFFLCLPLVGCTTVQKNYRLEPPVTGSVALMPFSSGAKGTVGQQAANLVALKLIESDHTVIDSSFTTSVVSEAAFYESGLTNEIRNALLAKNLTTLVFGNVNAFSCEPVKNTDFFGISTADKNRCTVSVTAKMVDTASGKLLWELIIADSVEDRGLTAFDVMKPLINSAISADTLPLPAMKPVAKGAGKQPGAPN